MTQAEQVTVSWAFAQNYHADMSNAAIHCSPVRFSPLTFALARMLVGTAFASDPDVANVLSHDGQYVPDPGRIAEDD